MDVILEVVFPTSTIIDKLKELIDHVLRPSSTFDTKLLNFARRKGILLDEPAKLLRHALDTLLWYFVGWIFTEDTPKSDSAQSLRAMPKVEFYIDATRAIESFIQRVRGICRHCNQTAFF